MVWGAPTSRSSGGRSAVTTSSGTRSRSASTTAGCSSAAAVPLVVSTTAGRPVARPSPSAMNAPERSSWCTWTRTALVGGQGQRHRRRPRARAHHGVGDARTDPLVDERGAEGRVEVTHAGDGEIGSVSGRGGHGRSLRAGAGAGPTLPGVTDPDARTAPRRGRRASGPAGRRPPRSSGWSWCTASPRPAGAGAPFADDLGRDHELVLVDAPGHGGSAAVEADLPTGAAAAR